MHFPEKTQCISIKTLIKNKFPLSLPVHKRSILRLLWMRARTVSPSSSPLPLDHQTSTNRLLFVERRTKSTRTGNDGHVFVLFLTKAVLSIMGNDYSKHWQYLSNGVGKFIFYLIYSYFVRYVIEVCLFWGYGIYFI